MKKIFLSAAVIGLLASCSQTEGLSVDNSTADSRQIQLSVGVATCRRVPVITVKT